MKCLEGVQIFICLINDYILLKTCLSQEPRKVYTLLFVDLYSIISTIIT